MSAELVERLPLQWGAPKSVHTRKGLRSLRTATPGEKFWAIWKEHKVALKELGVSVGKEGDSWEVRHWAKTSAGSPAPAPARASARSKPLNARLTEKAEAHRMAQLAASLPVPAGLSYLPYQVTGIDWLRSRERSILADEMGLGKTVQALGLLNATRPDVTLIVCPAHLKTNWQEEARKWLVGDWEILRLDGKCDALRAEVLSNSITAAVKASDKMLVVINYDILASWRDALCAYLDSDGSAIILDEGHYIKNREAARTTHAATLCSFASRVVIMTGTPIVNRPEEIFVPARIVGATNRGWIEFTDFYCAAYHDSFGVRKTHGASNLEALRKELGGHILRRRKAAVLPQLPDKIRQVIPLQPNAAGRAAIKEEWSLLHRSPTTHGLVQSTGIDFESMKKGLGAAGLAEFSKARLQTGLTKVKLALQHIKDMLDNDLAPEGKLIVFAHHTEVIMKLRDALSAYGSCALTGKTLAVERDRCVKTFQKSPGARVFIGSIGACGTGLTLTAASTVIFVEGDWSPQVNLQCEDRAHRIGQSGTVLVQYLTLAGSIDAQVIKANIKKQGITNAVIDGGDAG